MLRRSHRLLSLIAALGVLLHAGTAAAQVFCAMTGALSIHCCCGGDERPDGPALAPVDEGCCRDALPAPSTDLQPKAPMPAPTAAAAWARVILPDPEVPVPAAGRDGPSLHSPLLGLQTIVLLR